MIITTKFEPGDTIWFVDTFTLLPVSTTVIRTDITIDSTLTPVINYFISINGIERYVNDTQAFATQEELGVYYSGVAP